jgi:hypothetical protein
MGSVGGEDGRVVSEWQHDWDEYLEVAGALCLKIQAVQRYTQKIADEVDGLEFRLRI